MILHILAVIAIVACAQPGGSLDATLARLAAIESKLAETSTPIAEQARLLDEAITHTRRLVSDHRSDTYWPAWPVDLAALILRRLAVDGTDSTVLLGLPSHDQRRRAAKAAMEATELLTLSTQDNHPATPRTSGPFMLRKHMIGTRAGVLLLAAGEDPGRALDTIGHPPQPATGAAEQARRVSHAIYLLHKGTLDDVAEAGRILSESLDAEEALPQTRAEILAAWLHANLRLGTPPNDVIQEATTFINRSRGMDAAARFAHASLITESVARAMLDAPSDDSPSMRISRACEAIEQLTTWMDSPAIARSWAIEKLSWRADGAWPVGDVPVLAVLARARHLERAGQRMEAAKILSDESQRVEGPDRLEAMRARLRLLLMEAEYARSKTLAIEAINLGASIVEEFPSATMHIEPCLIVAKALTTRPDSDPADTQRLAQWLDIGLANPTALGELDYWKLDRGDLRAAQARTPSDTLSALADYDSIDRASAIRTAGNERYRDVATTALANARSHVAELRRAEDDAALRTFASEQWLPLAKAAALWAESNATASRATFSRSLADALVEAAHPGADVIYRTLLAETEPGSAAAQELSLGLARALLLANKDDQAFALLRDVAMASDTPTPDGSNRPERFWHAWTLMLETLLEIEDSHRQRTAITTRLTQLESIDPNLGGPPWRNRLNRIREAVTR